jgi:hypothetical protein
MSTQYFGNVHFLGVARVAGTGIVIASHSYNTEIDLNGVRQVLEQPNMNLTAGKHYSFNVGPHAWHLISGNSLLLSFSLIFLTLLLLQTI